MSADREVKKISDMAFAYYKKAEEASGNDLLWAELLPPGHRRLVEFSIKSAMGIAAEFMRAYKDGDLNSLDSVLSAKLADIKGSAATKEYIDNIKRIHRENNP